MNPPPSNQTSTGAPPAGTVAGAHTLSVRQSSDVPGASEPRDGSFSCIGSKPNCDPS